MQLPGFLSTLKGFILPANHAVTRPVTNTLILNELIQCFEDSCKMESVGTSLLFNTHFLVVLHPDVYETRLPSLPVIVKEAVKAFYNRLELLKKDFDDVSPISSGWHFKFGPGLEFNGEKIGLDDVKIIGMLTGLKDMNPQDHSHASGYATARVTMKSKKTNVFDRMDINLDMLRLITFLESGTFLVRFNPELKLGNISPVKSTANMSTGLARISYYIADKSKEEEYIMKDKEIVIARKEPANQAYSNYLLIDSAYVSNPHARIRLNEVSGKFQIASFSRNQTQMNEKLVERSEPSSPAWIDIEHDSKILLNGMVTLYFRNNMP